MKKRNLAFTVELLGLFILLVLVITVITQVFVMSRSHSLQARQLTEAVILAESTAEVSSTEKDMAGLAEKIGSMKQVIGTGSVTQDPGKTGGSVWAGAAFRTDDASCKYYINITRQSTPSGSGVYAEDLISIYSAEDIMRAAENSGVDSGEPEALAGALAAMGEGTGDGAVTEDGSAAGIGLPEPVYTLKAGKYFGEDE